MKKAKTAILWRSGSIAGYIEATNAAGINLTLHEGQGNVEGVHFSMKSPGRLILEVEEPRLKAGSDQTTVTVWEQSGAFTFFLRDVNAGFPILLREYGFAVTTAEDRRSFDEIEREILDRGGMTELQRIENEPETTFEQAARETRDLRCPTWLGISRDMRLFEVDFRQGNYKHAMDIVKPRYPGGEVHAYRSEEQMRQGLDGYPSEYGFLLGRGWGCINDTSRHLEAGCLPVLHGTLRDGEICYLTTCFVVLEAGPLTAATVRGTHFLVADGHTAGHMFTTEQQKLYDSIVQDEMEHSEETVLFFRARAINTGPIPRYAWFHAPEPMFVSHEEWATRANGFGICEKTGEVFAITTIDGMPVEFTELAVLISPGQQVEFVFKIPHHPISRDRAIRLAEVDFEQRYRECREFWETKLQTGAQIDVPEKRINDMIKAGLLHLDLICYGREPDKPLAPTIGRYAPIGSESSPIIQFFDSMGWHEQARRSLIYFLEKQHESGFIQNFGGYMIETGPVLWSLGEHFRYTRDTEWIKQIQSHIIKACNFMLQWRSENQKEELRGKGYGMQAGKVADPEDNYHSFMLNGYAYLGLSRAAEMLAQVNPSESGRLKEEAQSFKADIVANLEISIARSPVVPLGDGTWCPTCAPWTEARGPVSLFTDEGRWFTHGTFVGRDSLVGPLYLIFQEVLEPEGMPADWLVKWQSELMCLQNVAFSQPYYSRHPIISLRRGEVKTFLRAYYYGFSGLSDRETYTFWEHYFGVSPHKTHEEAWFLMQTRWMLYQEHGATIKLLAGIPRAWLASGKSIRLKNVATYFGPMSLLVESRIERDEIRASFSFSGKQRPKMVDLRLPHPLGLKARSTKGGIYMPEAECVRVEPKEEESIVFLTF